MADTVAVLGAKRTGVPSPEGNPKIKQLYGRGTGKLPAAVVGPNGNARLVPIAPWSHVRLHIEISQAGVLNLGFCDGQGELIGKKQATGLLTLTGQPLDTETVVINGKTYTFQTVLTNVDGNVLIGVDAADSLRNLIAAVNLEDGAGTKYAALTTWNGDVSARSQSALVMQAVSQLGGLSGNALTTTETLTNGAWGAGTLSGGLDSAITADETAIVADTALLIDIPGVHDAAPEHIGEPYLMVSVTDLGAATADVVVFDAMGSSW